MWSQYPAFQNLLSHSPTCTRTTLHLAHRPASIGIAVQAYGRRALPTLEFLEEVARAHPATEVRVRLVKGAYWDSEIKEAQVRGADVYPVWTRKRNTDVSYLACAAFLLNSRWLAKPAFATHNTRTVADVLAMTTLPEFVAAGCEFQRLHGMGESFDYSGAPLRVYAPTGTTSDLLAYLVRRMLENGANSSFLKQLADGREHLLNVDVLEHNPPGLYVNNSAASSSSSSSDLDTSMTAGISNFGPQLKLWAATTAASTAAGAGTSSSSLIPTNPRAIYRGRLAARGVDYEHPDFPALFARTPAFAPAVFFEDAGVTSSARMVGRQTTTVGQRADVLRGAADIIEAEALPLAKLVMEEAGKTFVDAVNEVRECVDFFRFYARQAEQTLVERRLTTVTGEECVIAPQPRGPWLCVGPFNFPFAIVVGGLSHQRNASRVSTR
jgi:RHH-type proline utilization regulon transcriptional repressor/proline dehydrogenase/delta 1-pyrroline-5-carboxylate dehydrogenase